jgi:two-component system, OmpR family, phosphate regulon sensor histidine kinase PhoR
MIRSPQELTESIRSAVNRRAVLFSHILLLATIVGHTVIDPGSRPDERIISIIIGAVIASLIIFRVFDFASINNHPKVYLAIYHLCAIVGLAFISDPVTPYVIVWFLIVFWSNLYYGSNGVWAAVASFSLMTIIKYIYVMNTETISVSDQLYIWAPLPLFIACCSMFIHIQKVFDWDRDRLHDSIKQAQVEEKRLRALINNMTESVLVLDTNGIVRLYNAAALGLFDTNTNLDGKMPEEFIKLEDEKGKHVPMLDLLPKDDKPVSRNDIVLRYGEDDTAALSVTVTPLRTSFGQEDEDTGYIITMRDITREKSLEEERNEFISVISHELRTPVTVTEASISNSMLVNEKNGNNEQVGKSLKLAHDQSIYLANMLNDLSTFARAEKGTLELNLESFSPSELVDRLAIDYHNEAEVKGMDIKSRASDGLPKTIASNRLYIREILQNFITNAIKYSDTGTVTVMAQPVENGVKFSVKDEGIGISTSDQKKVFDKFFRSEDFRTRSRNGTGLGLYIVKKLAKIIQANFELESELGKGSTFSLVVPDLSSKLQQHHPGSDHEAPEPEEGMGTPSSPTPIADAPPAPVPEA